VTDRGERQCGFVGDRGDDVGHGGVGGDEVDPVLASGCGDLALAEGVVDGVVDLLPGRCGL